MTDGKSSGRAADMELVKGGRDIGNAIRGLELSERFFGEYGLPMLQEQFPQYMDVIAAGVAGEGSDCFGFDDAISRDHDFEAGFCLWIPDRLEHELEFKLSRAYGKLPEEYLGVRREKQSLLGGGRRGVLLTGEFYRRFTGRPGAPESLMEWLYTPEHSLACAVNGRVFYDGCGEFSAVRRELEAGYPEDVRLKKMAARAVLMAQSGQYNYSRCLRRGEYGAAAMALHEFVSAGLSMIFLLNRRYMPYYKWSFRAARDLPVLREAAGELERLLTGGAAVPGDAAGVYEPGNTEPGDRNGVCGSVEKEADGTEGSCGSAKKRLAGGPVRTEERIEGVCRAVVQELKRQGLTGGDWDYLEPHAMELTERIRDGELRNLHVMEG